MTTDQLNTVENTLLFVLANSAARRAGELARHHGWPPLDEAQAREIGRVLTRALTELIRGMRQPGILPPGEEEISAVLDGMALGAIEKVLGPPPAPEASATN
jgi:hypothetical protein